MTRLPRISANNIRLGDRLIIKLDNSGPDNTIAIDKDDIILPVKQRLGDYLAAMTAQTQNAIPVTTGYSEFATHDAQGYTAPMTPPGDHNQESYTGDMAQTGPEGATAVSSFNKHSKTGQLDTGSSAFAIRKGNENSDAPSITDVITDINEKGGVSDFAKRMDQVLFDNNRFREGKSFLPRSGVDRFDGIAVRTLGSQGESSIAENESNLGIGYVQQKFGVHGPRKFPTTEGDTSTIIKLADLKKIGLLTMLQASGEYYVPTDPNDVAQQLAARGAQLVPGLARMGQKVGVSRFNAAKIMHDVNPEYLKPSLDDNIKKNEVLSYGNVNNWMAPFSGLVDTAGIASAGLLLVVVGGLMKALATLVAPNANVATNPSDNAASPGFQDRRKRMGSYLGKDSETSAYKNDAIQLDVYQTTHNFFACVDRGINIFFDAQSGPIPTAGKLLRHHGYYNTVLRTIVRSTTDFFVMTIDSTVNRTPPNGSFGVNDVTILGNPLALGAMIDKFNSSALLKFVNIVASIGDVALTHEEDGYEINLNGVVSAFISSIDNIPERFAAGDLFPEEGGPLNIAVLQGKNRLADSTLAWKQNSVQSLYLLPRNVLQGVSLFVGTSNQDNPVNTAFSLISSKNAVADPSHENRSANNRIKPEVVKQMEDYLEADYMPFYWQDLRTNEIISFHAFLEDVSDGYDAEYQEIEGYGRIGSVPIYKNTKRSISLSFRVVATNPEDFDQMWWKINKFVTLVYPQYTTGRQIGTGNNKFVQPFSQIPSASPLVRLRLGDLFKTNYSTIAVARLFGIDSGQFQLDELTASNFSMNATFASRQDAATRRMSGGLYENSEEALLRPNYSSTSSRQERMLYPRVDGLPPSNNSRVRRGNAGTPRGNSISDVVDHTNVPATGPARNLHAASALRVIIMNNTPIGEGPNNRSYHVRVINAGAQQDGTYLVHQSSLTPLPDQITKAAARAGAGAAAPTTNSTTPQAIQDFFDASDNNNANPVMKAFASTKGRGLAGVIKSIRFDYSDARWATDRANGRAPMSMKLAVEFMPVHDINPGLDHNGFNTAPLYNTGEIMKSFSKDPLDTTDNVESRVSTARAKFVPPPRNGTNRPGG